MTNERAEPRVSQLGYLGFEVSSLARWETFATEILGLEVTDRRDDGGLSLRMDGRAQRFFIEPGKGDDLACIGWQVDDEGALDALAETLREAGTPVSEGSPEEARARRVTRLVKYVDPAGIPSELFVGPELATQAFSSSVMRSGFVADELGLGHLVISANTQEESRRFYCDLLGFRPSDRIVCDIHGFHVDIAFFHANRRHHSLAFGDRQRKRMHHFMLEVRSIDDVGLAFDRCLSSGVKIMQTLGRHPNDRMFSFYAKTPSGFQFEVGWGGREIDDATWQETTYDHISEWGHHPPSFLAAQK